MSRFRFILRSLVYYRRTNVGVALGVAVAAAIIIGALLVGSSVRYSLKRIALDRLGQVDYALPAGDRLVTTGLVERLRTNWEGPGFAGVLQLPGVAVKQGAGERINNVQILGVDDAFWSLAPDPSSTTKPDDEGVVLNRRLADTLGVEIGDRVLLRIAKPSALPRDIPIGSEADNTITLSADVTAIADAEQFGLYSLQGSQIPPFNAYVPMKRLQDAAGVGERVNTLLASYPEPRDRPIGPDSNVVSAEAFDRNMQRSMELADFGMTLDRVPDTDLVALRSRRVFLDPVVVKVAEGAPKTAAPSLIMTYFVNSIDLGERSTPYSMVSTRNDLAANEIEIVQWLARDLGAMVGDELTLRYFVLGENEELTERSSRFTIKRIVPTEGPDGDRQLMPDFPGISDADSARSWEPGIPIDLSRIRDVDEDYWKDHKGSPKAFVSLDWARETWGNRFGDLTQVRWPGGDEAQLNVFEHLMTKLDPTDLGLVWQPVRGQALTASQSGTDFGGLFIGLSFFIVIAALLLVGLLFVFGVEQRAAQTGTLMAIGYAAKRVRRLWIAEGAVLAVVGTIVGVPLGFGYTLAVLWALTTQWSGAIAQTRLWFHADPVTVAIGAVSSILVAVFTMGWVLRRQTKMQPRELMAAKFGGEVKPIGRLGLIIGCACVGAAAMMAASPLFVIPSNSATASAFFSAATLLLIGAILITRSWIGRLDHSAPRMTVATLARRNVARRRGRSLAVVALLASGCFLVIAINAFRHDPAEHPERESSGTGGFDTFAELTIPLHKDLNTEAGLDDLAIDPDAMKGVTAVPMRLRTGDDASCLNLNAPQSPPLLGVDPAMLAERFTFVRTIEDANDPWTLLNGTSGDVIPAAVDDAVAQWIIKKGLGDTIEYVDDHGKTIQVKIVATLAPAVMQGYLVISEAAMKAHFPSVAGDRVLLLDAPDGEVDAMRKELSFALVDYGINLTDTADRLRMFTAVEHTYLTIFGVLGSLGVLLGSVGLGLVVMRNVLERRSELALMRAVGFVPGRLRWLVMREHWTLALLGLICGGIAAAVAVAPALAERGGDVPWATMAWTLGGVLISAGLWTAVAATSAVRGRLIQSLRSE